MLTMVLLVYSCSACTTQIIPRTEVIDNGDSPAVAYMRNHTVRVSADCPGADYGGTGVILASGDAGSLIATAKHIGDSDCTFRVINRLGGATVIRREVSKDYDIAFLVVLRKYPVAPVTLAVPRMGNRVYATGYPMDRMARNRQRLTFSTGVVMSEPYGKTGYLRVSAHILSGSSGGPCWNASGDLVGLTVSMWGRRSLSGYVPFDGHYYIMGAQYIAEALQE